MTRPLSLSEFSPMPGTPIPNGPHGDVDKRFAAVIQHVLEEQARAEQAPTRGSSNEKSGAATPTPLPPHDASDASSQAGRDILTPFRARGGFFRNLPNFTPIASNTTGSGEEQPGGGSRQGSCGLFGQGAIGALVRDASRTQLTASGNTPPRGVPAAYEPNSTAAESETTLADQQPAGAGRGFGLVLSGKGELTLRPHESNPRNPFRIRTPIPGVRPDLSAAVALTGGVNITPKVPNVEFRADGTVFTKGFLREDRAEYSTVAIGAQATRKWNKTELTGRYQFLHVTDGAFKSAHELSGSYTRYFRKSTAAISGTVGGRSADVPAQNNVSLRAKIRAQIAPLKIRAPLMGEAEYRVNMFTTVPRTDHIITGRGGVTFGDPKKNVTIGGEFTRQTLPGGQKYSNMGFFAQIQFGGSKRL